MSFTNSRKAIFAIALILIVAGIVCIAVRGFNPDVDFTGGTSLTVANLGEGVTVDQSDIIAKIESHPGVTVSSFQMTTGETTGFLVKIKGMTEDEELRQTVSEELRTMLKLTSEDISSSTVGATVSGELRTAAIVSAVIAIVLMLVYITVRFDFSSGLAAVTCLAHDLFFMLVFYSLLQIPMGSTMIAALLTILGYSINATIIIFDRVRENRKAAAKDATFDEIVDRSVKQTLRRSIFTSVTTLVVIVALYIACKANNIFAVTNFALPLVVGIVAGFFSSVCLSGNLWSVYNTFFKRFRKSK